MKLRYMLDTNICIYIAKHQSPEVKARFERLRPGRALGERRPDEFAKEIAASRDLLGSQTAENSH
jgi:predicted nucleic acid-binding protein